MSVFGLTHAHSLFYGLSNTLFYIAQKLGATAKKKKK